MTQTSKSKPPMNFMVDIETLGTRSTSVILSVAIVSFGSNDYSKTALYQRWDSTLLGLEFTVDVETQEWWKTQPHDTWLEAACGEADPKASLEKIAEALAPYDCRMWSKGVGFDFPLLQHAFDIYGVKCPWTFRQLYDFRTVQSLYPALNMKPDPKKLHSALYDAIFQAQYLEMLATEHGIPGIFLGDTK